MNRSEILKKQLAEYERKATALEGVVLKDLNYLEKRKNAKDIVILEGKIQSRLRRLDSYQEEIDSISAELKEAGAYEYPDYSGNVYVYRLKKQPKQKPLKIQVSEARAEYRKESAKHKVYSTETTAQRKRREAKEAAAERRAEAAALKEAKALQKAQEAAERALKAKREPKPRVVKELKPKPVREPRPKADPKPTKPAESNEMKLAKKRRDSALKKLRNLDAQIESERLNLERRLIERKARVEAVAHLTIAEFGPQNRRTARLQQENVERQLRELPERKKQREERLLELVDLANLDILELLEKDSQLV
jgi:hypothetical protein